MSLVNYTIVIGIGGIRRELGARKGFFGVFQEEKAGDFERVRYR
jgi:hypothetical protein